MPPSTGLSKLVMALTGRKGQGPQKSTALPPETLRRTVDPASLGFDTTRSVTPASGLIGQDRALRAIQFGANIRQSDFNLFVLGPTGTGRHAAVERILSEQAARRELEEETGFRVHEIARLWDVFMSPGSVTERLFFFIGR